MTTCNLCSSGSRLTRASHETRLLRKKFRFALGASQKESRVATAPVPRLLACPHLRWPVLPPPKMERLLLRRKILNRIQKVPFFSWSTHQSHCLFRRALFNNIPQGVTVSKKFCKTIWSGKPYYDTLSFLKFLVES